MALKGLQGKIAVITGEAQELGAGIARRLLDEGAEAGQAVRRLLSPN